MALIHGQNSTFGIAIRWESLLENEIDPDCESAAKIDPAIALKNCPIKIARNSLAAALASRPDE